jgi:regulator of protease activity HflC (stomatin/prohibitin superfamily)
MDAFSNLGALLGGGLGVLAFFVLLGILKGLIKVAPPDKLLVVTGRKTLRDGKAFGFAVERGRTFALPYFQSVGSLDLGVLPVNVKVEGVNSANGISMGADATACVCIDDEDEGMLYSAVERLMGKAPEQIREQVQQTLVGNFRGALNKATPLQAIGMEDEGAAQSSTALGERPLAIAPSGERAQFRAELVKDIDSDLHSFGMKVVSVSLQKIWDGSSYIANLAQKTLAEKRRQVEVEESRLRAIASQAESDSRRRIQVATSAADEKIVEARQELEVFRREAQGAVRRRPSPRPSPSRRPRTRASPWSRPSSSRCGSSRTSRAPPSRPPRARRPPGSWPPATGRRSGSARGRATKCSRPRSSSSPASATTRRASSSSSRSCRASSRPGRPPRRARESSTASW